MYSKLYFPSHFCMDLELSVDLCDSFLGSKYYLKLYIVM